MILISLRQVLWLPAAAMLLSCGSAHSRRGGDGFPLQPTGQQHPLNGGGSDGHLGLTAAGLDGMKLVIALDQAPPPGSAALSSCYFQLPADFAIGDMICASDSSKQVVLSAGSAEQVCRNNPDFGPAISPSKPFPQIAGCRDVLIKINDFSSPLTIEAVAAK